MGRGAAPARGAAAGHESGQREGRHEGQRECDPHSHPLRDYNTATFGSRFADHLSSPGGGLRLPQPRSILAPGRLAFVAVGAKTQSLLWPTPLTLPLARQSQPAPISSVPPSSPASPSCSTARGPRRSLPAPP